MTKGQTHPPGSQVALAVRTLTMNPIILVIESRTRPPKSKTLVISQSRPPGSPVTLVVRVLKTDSSILATEFQTYPLGSLVTLVMRKFKALPRVQ